MPGPHRSGSGLCRRLGRHGLRHGTSSRPRGAWNRTRRSTPCGQRQGSIDPPGPSRNPLPRSAPNTVQRIVIAGRHSYASSVRRYGPCPVICRNGTRVRGALATVIRVRRCVGSADPYGLRLPGCGPAQRVVASVSPRSGPARGHKLVCCCRCSSEARAHYRQGW